MKRLIICLCLFAAIYTYAQTDTTINRVVTVERDFQPVIQSAGKIDQRPIILQPDLQLNPVVYSTYSTPLAVGHNIHPLQVAETKFTPQAPLNGVLEGAIGHRNTHLLFGYQLHKKWYLSAIGELKTNFWNHYQKNSHELSTAFLTPIRFTLGVGVDYKPLKGLSVNIAPATYKMVCAAAANLRSIDVTEYGIEEGKDILSELGSSVRVDWKWRPLREIEVEANFYFFTNYKQVELDLEIDVDFIINKYLSAKLLLHPRYDGTIENVTDKRSKIQFKELISVGFAHTFK